MPQSLPDSRTNSQRYHKHKHHQPVQVQPPELGEVIQDRIVVRGSLQAGDQVVVSGQSRLADGDAVEVRS